MTRITADCRMSYYSKGNYIKDDNFGCFGPVLIVLLLIAVFLGSCYRGINKVGQRRTEIVTVTEKTVKRTNDEDKYIIFAKDKDGEINTYEVTDSWVAGRFNSSDVYGSIEVGKTYKFNVGGSRVPLFSWYPNIYGFEEVK